MRSDLSVIAARWFLAIVLISGAASFAACAPDRRTADGGRAGAEAVQCRRILKIAVMSDGRLLVDGAAMQLEALDQSLQRLKAEKGCVYYYRENASEAAPPVAREVIRAVVKARLPLRLSTKPDYSDAYKPTPLQRIPAHLRR